MENLLNYIIFLKLQKGVAPLQNTGVNYIGLTENGDWYLKAYSNGESNVVFRQRIFKQHQTEILNRLIQSINNAGGSIIMGEPSQLITHKSYGKN